MMEEEKIASATTPASTYGEKRRGQHLVPPDPRSAPWLMFQHGKNDKNQTFYNICQPNKTYYGKRIPEMRRKFCLDFSCHEGWLILTDSEGNDDKPDDYFLWNPVSLEKIQLPSIIYKSKEHLLKGVLSSPPSDPDSIVMLLYGKDLYYLLFCHPGDKKWIRKELGKFESSNIPRSLVAIRGKFYIMCLNNIHLEIERIEPETLSIKQFEVDRPPSSATHLGCVETNYVETCDDDLFMVRRWYQLLDCKEVMDLQVFRMDFSVMEWEEVRNWGDRVFFLGTHTTTSCSAAEMGFTRGGYVYFTLNEDKSLYKFDLEDGSVSVSLPCPKLPTPWCSPEWMIKPTVSRATEGRNSRTEDKMHINDNDNAENDTIMETKQKKVIKHYDDEEVNNWGMLNKDIVELITTYLHPVDYMHFREASRAFRSIAPPMRWRTSSPGIKDIDSLSPWLVFSKKKDGIYNFIDPMHSNEKHLINLSDLLSNANILFSKDGWLLMSKGERSIFFFNPLTRATIQLPDIEDFNNKFDGICFSSSPTSSDCSVFAISGCGPYNVHIHSIHRGVDSWTYDRFRNNDLPSKEEKNIVFIPCLSNPVFYRGAFYCLGYHGTLGVSEFNGSYSWKVLDKLQSPCNSYFRNFLVDCEGELLAVFVGHLGKWVKVFRLVHRSEEEMIWVQVNSLGKHMLFISHSSCLSAVAPRCGMENKIYFPRLNDREEIICYSLDTDRYHYFGSQHSHQEDFYDTKVQLYCSWIEPKWSKNTDEELDWLNR